MRGACRKRRGAPPWRPKELTLERALKTIAFGTIAGIAAIMTVTMRCLHGFLPAEQRYPLPPREITKNFLPAATLRCKPKQFGPTSGLAQSRGCLCEHSRWTPRWRTLRRACLAGELFRLDSGGANPFACIPSSDRTKSAYESQLIWSGVQRLPLR